VSALRLRSFGIVPLRLSLIGTVVGLVLMPLAAVAGARFYSEFT